MEQYTAFLSGFSLGVSITSMGFILKFWNDWREIGAEMKQEREASKRMVAEAAEVNKSLVAKIDWLDDNIRNFDFAKNQFQGKRV